MHLDIYKIPSTTRLLAARKEAGDLRLPRAPIIFAPLTSSVLPAAFQVLTHGSS